VPVEVVPVEVVSIWDVSIWDVSIWDVSIWVVPGDDVRHPLDCRLVVGKTPPA